MANRPVFTSFTVLDADGEKTAVRLLQQLSDATTIAQLLTATATVASTIDAVLDGKVVSYSCGVSLPTAGGTVKAEPVAGSEIERAGLISCDLVGMSGVDSMAFPAWKAGLFIGNTIDLTNADVILLTNLIAAAPYVNRYEVLHGGNVEDAVKVFRKHRKQTKRARGVS